MPGRRRCEMKSMPTLYLLVLLYSPLLAHAQVYKCKQADGSLHFQNDPCQPGASGSTIAMPPAAREPTGVARQPGSSDSASSRGASQFRKSPQEMAQDSNRRRAEQDVQRHNDEVKAYNRTQRCNYARQQLGVLRAPKPAYRLDNGGDRHYVEDQNRAAETATAEQRVAAECQ
jgi:hypothetical protein